MAFLVRCEDSGWTAPEWKWYSPLHNVPGLDCSAAQPREVVIKTEIFISI